MAEMDTIAALRDNYTTAMNGLVLEGGLSKEEQNANNLLKLSVREAMAWLANPESPQTPQSLNALSSERNRSIALMLPCCSFVISDEETKNHPRAVDQLKAGVGTFCDKLGITRNKEYLPILKEILENENRQYLPENEHITEQTTPAQMGEYIKNICAFAQDGLKAMPEAEFQRLIISLYAFFQDKMEKEEN